METITGSEPKATGYTEIRDKDSNLLVAFNSEDESDLGREYQKQRIKYCMRHRRDKIPQYLRTGERPENIRGEIRNLKLKNLFRR